MALSVAFTVFPGVEELDLAGPFEALALARDYGDEAIELFTVAASTDSVRFRGGLNIVPDHAFTNAPRADVVVVPGGPGTRDPHAWRPVVDWLEGQKDVPLLTSVCTGSFLLARAGLLAGRRATTHHSRLEQLRSEHPEIQVVDGARVVDEKGVITAGGVTSGIDLGLHLVERFFGGELRAQVQDVLEYPPG